MTDPRSMSWRGAIPRPRDYVAFAPHAGSHHPALRLFVSAVVPCVVLMTIGRTDLLAVAMMTSVAAVYGRNESARARLRMQMEMSALQICFIVAGGAVALAALTSVASVLLASLGAGVATAIADRRRWTPPGALFPTFGFAVIAGSEPAAGGLLAVLIVAVGAAAVSLAVTVAWSPRSLVQPPPTTHSARPLIPARVTWAHAAICVAGGALAGLVAVGAGLTHPYWAVVSAIVPVFGTSTHTQLVRGGHRLLGTILGLGCAAMLFAAPMSDVGMVGLLLALMICTELFVARNYAVALFFVTPMTVGFALLNGQETVPGLLLARGIETALGVVIAVVLILATHAVRHPRVSE